MLQWIALGGLSVLALAAAAGEKEVIRFHLPQRDDETLPARALSITQAKSILQGYREQNIISFSDFEGDFITMGSSIDGVAFHYSGKPTILRHIDVRFAVLLVRMVLFLKENFHAVVINHMGVYPGRADKPTDVHNFGRAMDLAGVETADGTKYDVQTDWGNAPVNYSIGADPAQYRLTSNQKGYSLFLGLYQFLTGQAADRNDQYVVSYPAFNNVPSRIGERGYILHPDHPNPSLRPYHQNHFHFQIGPTKN